MRSRSLWALVAVLALVTMPAMAENETVGAPVGGPDPDPSSQVWGGPRALLYDNGPLVNSPGTGAGGADESQLQTAIGMGIYGFGHHVSAGFRIADEFTIPAGDQWQIDTITFFAYQTGASTTSTITAVNLQIWDGAPNAGGSVVWGDTTTNVLSSTAWSNIYRVLDTTSGDTARAIMANTVTVGTTLNEGTYWLDWQSDGSLSSGPWAPPITINSQTTTGNALQSDGAAWAAVTDVGGQGFPFIIDGEFLGPTPTPGALQGIPTMSGRGIAVLVLLLVVVGVLVLRRVN